MGLFYRALAFSIWSVCKWVYQLKLEGLENVPRVGGLIIACNHVSWMDPPLLGCVVSRVRFPQFLAKQELFRNPFSSWFLRNIGVMPLNRYKGGGDLAAIRGAVGLLESGGCLVLFPEGTRSMSGLPGRPRPGVGFLSCEAGVPVIPARVWDTQFYSRFHSIRLKFGRSIPFAASSSLQGRDAYQEFSQRVMEEIFKL